MVQGKSSVLMSSVMEVSPFSVCADRRATRSYFCALMLVRVKVSEKRFASPMVAGVCDWRGGMALELSTWYLSHALGERSFGKDFGCFQCVPYLP